MKACATGQTLPQQSINGNLFLPVPDTDLGHLIAETEQLLCFAPVILPAIEADLDAYAKEKKRLRLEDRRFFESQTPDLPSVNIPQVDIAAKDLHLQTGRPRMLARVIYMFLMLRGYLGSISDQQAVCFLHESMNIHAWLMNNGVQMPGVSTIIENINAVSQETRTLIFDRQIAYIVDAQLDDFKDLTIDSTAVKANSRWPTDSKILTGLLARVHRVGQSLTVFGLKNFQKGWIPRWLEEMNSLDFQIATAGGKPNAKTKLYQHYRHLLRQAGKALAALEKQFTDLEQYFNPNAFAPSQRLQVERVVKQLRDDLDDAGRVRQYTHERIFENKTQPSTEKVLSLSDGSACFIQKGGREAVIGYKPQLVRSANGFVSSLIVPDSNAADSAMLVVSILKAKNRSGVLPGSVSTDDGYASAKGLQTLLDLGIKTVSISGAKGKKLTDPQDWDSPDYKQARRCRSSVESLMFTIKDGFEFDQLGRRGIRAVRDELLEKVLAYNTCRIILMRQRYRQALQQAA